MRGVAVWSENSDEQITSLDTRQGGRERTRAVERSSDCTASATGAHRALPAVTAAAFGTVSSCHLLASEVGGRVTWSHFHRCLTKTSL